MHGPRFLPDGKTLIYTLSRAADGRFRWDKAQIVAQTPGASDRRVLITGGSDARYVASGHLLYALEGIVLGAPFDPTRLEITGEARPVIEGVRRTLTGVTGSAQFDVSANGTLIYLTGGVRISRERFIAIVGREGTVSRLSVAPGPYEHVRASNDGIRIAIGSGEANDGIVWIGALDGRSPMRRLPLKGRNVGPNLVAGWQAAGGAIGRRRRSRHLRAARRRHGPRPCDEASRGRGPHARVLVGRWTHDPVFRGAQRPLHAADGAAPDESRSAVRGC